MTTKPPVQPIIGGASRFQTHLNRQQLQWVVYSIYFGIAASAAAVLYGVTTLTTTLWIQQDHQFHYLNKTVYPQIFDEFDSISHDFSVNHKDLWRILKNGRSQLETQISSDTELAAIASILTLMRNQITTVSTKISKLIELQTSIVELMKGPEFGERVRRSLIGTTMVSEGTYELAGDCDLIPTACGFTGETENVIESFVVV